MPQTEWGWEITPQELRDWTLHQDDHLWVINKPALVVCHPSKRGPWSSLVGACREALGVDRLHLPTRLDRETSGVVVLAKDPRWASALQTAAQNRQVTKRYRAILQGELAQPVTVDQPLARGAGTPVVTKVVVRPDGAPSVTEFYPVQTGGGYTVADVVPLTGRMHQIRAHAAWLGHPLVGDKIYGPDERLYLQFIETGWSARLQQQLQLPRQALHAGYLAFHLDESAGVDPQGLHWTAPWPPDLAAFEEQHLPQTLA